MTRAQQYVLIVSLCIAAVALSVFFVALDVRTAEGDEVPPNLLIPLWHEDSAGNPFDRLDDPNVQYARPRTFAQWGLYARNDQSSLVAFIGGVLVPLGLAATAIFLMLGLRPTVLNALRGHKGRVSPTRTEG